MERTFTPNTLSTLVDKVNYLEGTLEEFNPTFYLKLYPDLVEAGINTKVKARNHYLTKGVSEQRLKSKRDFYYLYSDFDWQYYTKVYPDVEKDEDLAIVHFYNFGRFQSRVYCEPSVIPTKQKINFVGDFDMNIKSIKAEELIVKSDLITQRTEPKFSQVPTTAHNTIDLVKTSSSTYKVTLKFDGNIPGNIKKILPLENEVYIVGDFFSSSLHYIGKYETTTNSISSLDHLEINEMCYDICSGNEGELYISGDFTWCSGVYVNHIFMLSKTGVTPLGKGLPRVVTCVLCDQKGLVYVGLGQDLYKSPEECLYKWNDNKWEPFLDIKGVVNFLEVGSNGEIYVAGNIDFNGQIYKLLVYDDKWNTVEIEGEVTFIKHINEQILIGSNSSKYLFTLNNYNLKSYYNFPNPCSDVTCNSRIILASSENRIYHLVNNSWILFYETQKKINKIVITESDTLYIATELSFCVLSVDIGEIIIGTKENNIKVNPTGIQLESSQLINNTTLIKTVDGYLTSPTLDENYITNKKSIGNILPSILQLNPIEYTDKEGGTYYGITTQNVQESFGNSMVYSIEGILGYDHTRLIPFLVKAIQEQQKCIEELKNTINNLIE